jgi:hypothetical protein
MTNKTEFTPLDKMKCCERELALRGKVYPAWIRNGRMKKATAERELALMEAILMDYRKKVKAWHQSSTETSPSKPTSGEEPTSESPPPQTSIKF